MTPVDSSGPQIQPAEASSEKWNAARERIARHGDGAYWRHLDEAEGLAELDEAVHQEFPSTAGEILDPVSRRNFFKVMGASMMLAGLAACSRQPQEQIVPYVKQPEEMIPGRPQYFATAVTLQGYGLGVVATSFEGRPTKLEGLKEHPSSLGATDIFTQASVLELYDPDRLDVVLRSGSVSTWNRFHTEVEELLGAMDAKAGAGLRFLSGASTSVTFKHQINRFLAEYPDAKWHQYEPCGRDNVRAGAQLAFGEFVDTVYDFSTAKVVLSLDANFLAEGVGSVRYARDFAHSRDVENNGGVMSRLYVAETSPTLTGASADHKLNVRYREVERLARAVAAAVGVNTAPAGDATAPEAWLNALVADLKAHGSEAIVIAGEQQPAMVHALAHAINEALGSTLVTQVESAEVAPTDQLADLEALIADMNAGEVSHLVILGGNPLYNTPAALGFEGALEQVSWRAHLTSAANETTTRCHWALPMAHSLEGWSDVRGHDGTASIVQPLILPLYAGRTVHEMLAVFLGEKDLSGREIVQRAWQATRGMDNFEGFWKQALGSGIVPGTAGRAKNVQIRSDWPAQEAVEDASGIELVFRPDPTIFDGQFANNGWLQELPKPLIRTVWDNAVLLHPQTARELELKPDDEVEIHYRERKVLAGVRLQFGHPQGVATLHLGYGRSKAGKIGSERGFNAYALQDGESRWHGTGASLAKTGNTFEIAHTDEHWNIEQSTVSQGDTAERRHLIREGTLHDFEEHPDFAQHMGHHSPKPDFTLYEPGEKAFQNGEAPYNWGMTIDLNKCTGCGVCTIACQAENNIPIVGKDEVSKGREMHWIRVDRYYRGDYYGEPEVVHQPIPCMQCENAPCEPVCPVGATVHSDEGLNDMVYNRCIGTRYCANNCPYKVRRFNFFHYQIREGQDAPSLKMMRNPNVTVRSRGVMEKCTYCVQRINLARIDAKVRAARSGNEDDAIIRDDELVTACQAACPSQAIAFGDINRADSKVSQEKAKDRNYLLIGDIGTRPRTSYLARLRNPNKELGPDTLLEEHGHH